MVTESNGNGYALYGGVKLPNIDTVWTDEVKETHPYACIQNNDDTAWLLVLSDVRPIYDGERVYVFNEDSGSEQPLYFYSPSNGATEWTAIGTAFGVSSADWTNTDILNTDGTTYLSASDPNPLDGMNVIEWDGDTEGLTVTSDVYYKVSDNILSGKDFLDSVVVMNAVAAPISASINMDTGDIEYADGIDPEDESTWPENSLMAFVTAGMVYIGESPNGLVFAAVSCDESSGEETGTYLMKYSTDIYTSLLAYTPATEDDTAETPTFTVNLSGAYTYTQGDTADTLSVTAEVSDGGTITYQWFMDDAEISGATDSGYTPATDTVGTRTYFCRVTNTLESGLTASADSDAVTVKVKFDIRGFVTGYLLTLAKGLLTVAAREPVAYLYNGVQLPALPEWDRETYPYAAITNTYVTYVFALDTPLKAINGYMRIEEGWFTACRYELVDGAWVKYDERLWSSAYSFSLPFWSNFDVLNADGTVYLAASEPTPVYE